MSNKPLLDYIQWTSLNESSKVDAVYFTVKFKEVLPIDDIIVEAVRRAVAPISEVCKLEKVTSDEFTISLNEEESYDIFSDLGTTEPITIPIKRKNLALLKYSSIFEEFAKFFPKIYESADNSAIFSLSPEKTGLGDDEIVEKVVNSDSFISRVNNSFFISINLKETDDFLSNKKNVELAFLAPDKKVRAEYSTQLSQFLLKKMFYEANVLMVESTMPFIREEIVLSDFKSEIDSKLAEFRERVNSRSDIKSLAIDIINFQKSMIVYTSSNDVRRRLASFAIIQTYDLFTEFGISSAEAIAILKNQ